jgi:hypothetical protein
MLEEQFESYLVQKEVIDQASLEAARTHAKKSGSAPLAEILGAGVATDQELSSLMAGYLIEQLQATLQWPDGEFAFAPGTPGLQGAITGKVSTTLFILGHVQDYPASLDKVRVRIGPPDILIIATKAAAQLSGLNPFQSRTLARCTEPIPLPLLLEEYAGQEEEIYRTVYGMLITGLLKKVEEEATEVASTLVSREEAQAWLGKKETSDHYGILGVGDEATQRVIRNSYYSLARKMHPDRFRSGPLQDLLKDVESFFTYVTDAYNTLIDPERRAEYNRQLAEAGAEKTEQTDAA